MEDVRLIVDIVIALGAATIGGLIAQRLGLPALIGYILAGLAIGPNTPGLVADVDRVQLLANLGVALLMFGLGVEFSLSEVIRVRRAALLGGAIQIPLTVVLGTAAGLAGGWTLGSALLLGGAFAISSSIVALKVLLGRGEMESPHARVALGLGIVQDFSLAPMLALIPVIAGQRGGGFGIAESLLISAVVLIAAFLLGTRLVPPLLRVVALSGSRELFMLTVVAIALGVALATHAVGLSLGLGAFLAGIVVSETDFEEQVLADIIPIRDIFATLFFVAVGMLIDPFTLLAQWQLVLGLALVLVVGKLLIIGGALLAAGVDHRTSTLAAVFMAQMGEFSFVLAGSGFEHGLIDIGKYGTILSVALCSILAMPILVAISPRLVRVAEHLPGVKRQERLAVGPPPPVAPAADHVVICGFGRVGAEIGAALDRWDQPYSVIELNRAQSGHRARFTRAGHRRVVWRCRLARRVGERGSTDRAHRRGDDTGPVGHRGGDPKLACAEPDDPRHRPRSWHRRGQWALGAGSRRSGPARVRSRSRVRAPGAGLAGSRYIADRRSGEREAANGLRNQGTRDRAAGSR
jgi:monovalent cation:H+ antiporter-2, CPA2 family